MKRKNAKTLGRKQRRHGGARGKGSSRDDREGESERGREKEDRHRLSPPARKRKRKKGGEMKKGRTRRERKRAGDPHPTPTTCARRPLAHTYMRARQAYTCLRELEGLYTRGKSTWTFERKKDKLISFIRRRRRRRTPHGRRRARSPESRGRIFSLCNQIAPACFPFPSLLSFSSRSLFAAVCFLLPLLLPFLLTHPPLHPQLFFSLSVYLTRASFLSSAFSD